MIKELIEQRLKDLETLKATALAQVNFYSGQESECRFWLSKFVESEKPTALKLVEKDTNTK